MITKAWSVTAYYFCLFTHKKKKNRKIESALLMLINLVTNGWMESLFPAPCYDEVDASWVNSGLQSAS